MTSTPSRLTRLPASTCSRSRTAHGREAERGISKRSCTAVATLLTFCPPGPEARMKVSSISFSSSTMPGATLIIRRVYGSLRRSTTGKLGIP
jgi:hypothetical protein